MTKYRVKVSAVMEFEIDSFDDYSANGDASRYVDENKESFDWSFDSIKNTETNKEV